MNLSTIQALVHLDDRPAQTPGEVNDALRRLNITIPPRQYQPAMQPEAIDAEFGVWIIWVPASLCHELIAEGQVAREGTGADLYAELP